MMVILIFFSLSLSLSLCICLAMCIIGSANVYQTRELRAVAVWKDGFSWTNGTPWPELAGEGNEPKVDWMGNGRRVSGFSPNTHTHTHRVPATAPRSLALDPQSRRLYFTTVSEAGLGSVLGCKNWIRGQLTGSMAVKSWMWSLERI
jgi:hypothetical protein